MAKNIQIVALAAVIISFTSCSTSLETKIGEQETEKDKFYEFYGSQLFRDVQLKAIFPDSKTFVDATPNRPLKDVQQQYLNEKERRGFNLEMFVKEHFEMPRDFSADFRTDTASSMKEHLVELWPVLSREPDKYEQYSSLIPLPEPYIVPGGRFREIYYWDSYFTIEGLMRSGQEEMAQNMVDNFSHLIDSLGFIPNGNRAYYLGRSQPPFYSLMVDKIAGKNRDFFLSYHDQLLREYQFWMDGRDYLSESNAQIKRVVLLPDGSILNRYWDNYAMPRPESYKEDYELVHHNNLSPDTTYRHLRAGAESGWDYSSRWFKDHHNLSTIHTTDIIPVDLNALLYHLELKIAQGYNWKEDLERAALYLRKATERKEAIDEYLWDEESMFYQDYDFTARQSTGVFSLAAAYPLFFNLASKKQAKSVIERLQSDFLQPGGFVTTLNETGEQWDFPNGWAPLQWITVNGLYNYGYGDLGNEAAERWLSRNREVFNATGKMMEKYDVVNTDLLAGGGEYPLQDGFGWTNGIALAFMDILEQKAQVEEMMVE